MWTKRVLITPQSIQPSQPELRVLGTFNPGAVLVGRQIYLIVRVAEAAWDDDPGSVNLPRWGSDGQIHIDRYHTSEIEAMDARVVRVIATGAARLTSVSHLRVFVADVDRYDQPDAYRELPHRFLPTEDTETMGMEDPRITRIEDRFYITYVAVSHWGVCTSLASTIDFQSFQRHGVIFPCENKDVLLFPERIDDQYIAMHRPVPCTPFGKPQIWLARSPDLNAWGHHQPLHVGDQDWQRGRVGGGTPPIRTDAGWLTLFHGNRPSKVKGEVGEYCSGAMLLDHHQPQKILRVSSQPNMIPTELFEQQGFVPGVVFPTALIQHDHQSFVFYGAADEVTAVATTVSTNLENIH